MPNLTGEQARDLARSIRVGENSPVRWVGDAEPYSLNWWCAKQTQDCSTTFYMRSSIQGFLAVQSALSGDWVDWFSPVFATTGKPTRPDRAVISNWLRDGYLEAERDPNGAVERFVLTPEGVNALSLAVGEA
mgnify:CR=1 FL=1